MPLTPRPAMPHCLPILLLAAWAVVFAPDRASAADPVYPKGLRVRLSAGRAAAAVSQKGLRISVPAAGHSNPSARFPAFADSAPGLQVSMFELPPPAAE